MTVRPSPAATQIVNGTPTVAVDLSAACHPLRTGDGAKDAANFYTALPQPPSGSDGSVLQVTGQAAGGSYTLIVVGTILSNIFIESRESRVTMPCALPPPPSSGWLRQDPRVRCLAAR